MAPWSVTLPLLKHVLPLPRLARLMAAPRDRERDPTRERAIAKASWWASRFQPLRFPENCLERSLVAYRFLGLAGADPNLVLGVSGEEGGVIGHVWVTVDGQPVQDPLESLRRYRRLIEFDRNGAPTGPLDTASAWAEARRLEIR